MTAKPISYRRMWRLDQILSSRFGWDIVYLLDCAPRDGEHHSRAGVKLAQFIPSEQVDSVFDCLFGDEEIDATTMWSLLGMPGAMPPVAPRRRSGRRGMTIADMLAARKAPAPAAAPPPPPPVVAVAPAPVAPAPDPMMAQMLTLLQTMQATNAALASRLTALEIGLGVDADLPPAAPVQEEAAEEAQEEIAEEVQEEPEAIDLF